MKSLKNQLTEMLSIVGLVGSIVASAQTRSVDRDHFEAVSIHPADLRSLTGGSQAIVPCSGAVLPTAGRVAITAATVLRLIVIAYGSRSYL